MKKYLKLIVSCLLISICCFCVVECGNNSKSVNVSEQETYNNSNDEHIQRINKEVNNFLTKEGFVCKANVNDCNVGIIIKDSYCSNNCPIVLQNGFIYRLYNSDSWTLLDRFNRDLSNIKGY